MALTKLSFDDDEFRILVFLTEHENFLIKDLAQSIEDFPVLFAAGKRLEETGFAYVTHDTHLLRNRIHRGSQYDVELFTKEVDEE